MKKLEWTPPDVEPSTATIRIMMKPSERDKLIDFSKSINATLSSVVRAALHYYIDAAPGEIPQPKDFEATP